MPDDIFRKFQFEINFNSRFKIEFKSDILLNIKSGLWSRPSSLELISKVSVFMLRCTFLFPTIVCRICM